MNAVLYVHGKGGCAAESAHYAPLFPDCRVVGLDYRTFTPWETGAEIHAAAQELKAAHGRVFLVANSIGAYFCLFAALADLIETAYFISPVLDMEGLICGMLAAAGVSEAELRARGEIPVPSGETLSWDYLCFVRSHPIDWRVPTHILYGQNDEITPFETAAAFAGAHGATLTVMEAGEHWFHTEAQMRFLDDWIRRYAWDRLETDRLCIYPATRAQMEAAVSAETDAELQAAYRQMLDCALQNPAQWAWYAMWTIESRDGARIGDLCFKGLAPNGVAEIGYGILAEYQGHGYATEAVMAALDWAFSHPAVTAVEAEAEAGNLASLRVLAKCGFVPNGSVGEEGPRFTRRRPAEGRGEEL